MAPLSVCYRLLWHRPSVFFGGPARRWEEREVGFLPGRTEPRQFGSSWVGLGRFFIRDEMVKGPIFSHGFSVLAYIFSSPTARYPTSAQRRPRNRGLAFSSEMAGAAKTSAFQLFSNDLWNLWRRKKGLPPSAVARQGGLDPCCRHRRRREGPG